MDATTTTTSTTTNPEPPIFVPTHQTPPPFLTLCQTFLSEIRNFTPGAPLERHLNTVYGPGTHYYTSFCEHVKRGLEEGWVAHTPVTGPCYRRSKVAEPCAETMFFGITTVFMDSRGERGEAGEEWKKGQEDGEEVLRGQYHVHPYGEINCVVPIDETAELKGMNGWMGAGWTSPGPGTHHYPEVRGGALVALFFLPAGRIGYDVKPGGPQPVGA